MKEIFPGKGWLPGYCYWTIELLRQKTSAGVAFVFFEITVMLYMKMWKVKDFNRDSIKEIKEILFNVSRQPEIITFDEMNIGAGDYQDIYFINLPN